MPVSFIVPAEIFGLGIVISMGIAVLIKVMMYVIQKTTKDTEEAK